MFATVLYWSGTTILLAAIVGIAIATWEEWQVRKQQKQEQERLTAADRVLVRELERFTTAGLMQLRYDLSRGRLPGRDWRDCPLSYRNGFPGSVLQDSQGARSNAFTRLWDEGLYPVDRLLEFVDVELRRRTTVEA